MLRMLFLTNKLHYFGELLEIGFTKSLKKNSTSPKNWLWLSHQSRFFYLRCEGGDDDREMGIFA